MQFVFTLPVELVSMSMQGNGLWQENIAEDEITYVFTNNSNEIVLLQMLILVQ